ncbi:11316_t:CDS:2 [Entrophospora sp. SA101]|nr:4128_t:CDS:2 [Entrophospora sp. SA101]CAJ0922729.1 11316_t:CDS:2 [Entrophospora sp. SA101]
MPNKITIFLIILTIITALLYEFLSFIGLFRETPKAYSGDRCRKIDEKGIEACEDIVIHHESGYAFMACGNSELRRTHWFPGSGVFKNKIIQYRETVFSYNIDVYVVLHGFGIHQDPADHNVLYLFLINHKRSGSVVEIFSHIIGSQELHYMETIKDDLINSPNNVFPVSKNEFYVTNVHYSKNPFMVQFEFITRRPWSNVAFYSGVNNKTEIAADKICYPNGIDGNWDNSRIYLSTSSGKFFVFERNHDNKLKLLDDIEIGFGDNISVDDITGEIYLATFPKIMPIVHFSKGQYETHIPTIILKISNNTNEDKFNGIKYSKEIVFQDDGSFFSFVTVAAVDRKRNALLLGSIYKLAFPLDWTIGHYIIVP